MIDRFLWRHSREYLGLDAEEVADLLLILSSTRAICLNGPRVNFATGARDQRHFPFA